MNPDGKLLNISVFMVHLLLHESHPCLKPHVLVPYHVHLQLQRSLLLLQLLLLQGVDPIGVPPAEGRVLQELLDLLSLQLEDAPPAARRSVGCLSALEDERALMMNRLRTEMLMILLRHSG